MAGIQTGSFGGKPQDNRKEGNGFGMNLSTLMDVAGIVIDASTGNIPGAAMGVAGFVDDASGNALLGEKGAKMLDLAQSGISLGSAGKNLIQGGAKAAVEGVEAGAGIADLGKDIGKVAAGTGDDALSLGLTSLNEGKNAFSLADGLATGSADQFNMFQDLMAGGEKQDVIKQLFEGTGAKDAGFDLKDLLAKMSKYGNKGLEYAQTGADLAELYTQVRNGNGGTPAPGMAPNMPNQMGPTVASQFQKGY